MMQLASTGRSGWNPFAEMRQLQSDMNRLFETSGMTAGRQTFPPVNLWLGENSVVVTAELPGLSTDDVDLTVREDMLTIQGERRPDEGEDERAWHRRERPRGKFSRAVELPFRIDPDKVDARFENGVLAIEMQRPEEERPRKIKIKGH